MTDKTKVTDDHLIAVYNRLYPDDNIGPDTDPEDRRRILPSMRRIVCTKTLLDALKVMEREDWVDGRDLARCNDSEVSDYVRQARAMRSAFGVRDGPLVCIRCGGKGVDPVGGRRRKSR